MPPAGSVVTTTFVTEFFDPPDSVDDLEVHVLGYPGQPDGLLLLSRHAWAVPEGDPGAVAGRLYEGNENAPLLAGGTIRHHDTELTVNAFVTADEGALTATVVGDVDFNGTDDLLVQLTPDVGDPTVLLVTGDGGGRLVPHDRDDGFDSAADFSWTGSTLGGGIFAVGDVDRDGYDDLAFAGGIVGTVAHDAALTVIAGDWRFARDESFTQRTLLTIAGAPGAAGLDLTVGDFDGDGRIDAAIADLSAGTLHVHSHAFAEQNRDLIADATHTLTGEAAGDGFGVLAGTPHLDLDGDRIDDLVVAAPLADVNTALATDDAGRIYVVYGGRTGADLPKARQLSNDPLTDGLIERAGRHPLPLLRRRHHARRRNGGAVVPVPHRRRGSAGRLPEDPRRRRDRRPHGSPAGGADSAGRSASARPTSTTDARGLLSFIGGFDGNGNGTSLVGATAEPGAGEFAAAGDGHSTLVTLDLARYHDLADDPAALARVFLALPYEAVRAQTGSVTVELLDGASGSVPVAAELDLPPSRFLRDDGKENGQAVRFDEVESGGTTTQLALTRGGPAHIDAADLPGDELPGIGELRFDLTAQIRDALAAGQTKFTFKVSATTAAELRFDLEEYHFQVETARRDPLVADLFDATGRKLAGGRSVLDLRSLEAGEFFVRVYDPFADAGLTLGEGAGAATFDPHPLFEVGYAPAAATAFTVEIEAPKRGDHDAITDRDELRGGKGNDVLIGGPGLDRLYGDAGTDEFTAEVREVRDLLLDQDGDPVETRFDPAAGDESSIVPLRDDFVVGFDNATLGLLVADELGRAREDAGGRLRADTLLASDLTGLVELDADLWSHYLGWLRDADPGSFVGWDGIVSLDGADGSTAFDGGRGDRRRAAARPALGIPHPRRRHGPGPDLRHERSGPADGRAGAAADRPAIAGPLVQPGLHRPAGLRRHHRRRRRPGRPDHRPPKPGAAETSPATRVPTTSPRSPG